jgi:hypothetical protein
MADAFLSYSRKDKAFAVALRERLEAAGFEILLDVEDILPSEDWARRLVDMIAAADHVVFPISPDSCQSRVCSIEIETALDLSKSIIPGSRGSGRRPPVVIGPSSKSRSLGGIDQAIFTADGRRIVTIGGHAGAAMWRLDGVQEGSALDGEFESVWRTPGGDVLALRNDFSVELWGTAAALERKATFTPFATAVLREPCDTVRMAIHQRRPRGPAAEARTYRRDRAGRRRVAEYVAELMNQSTKC